MPTTRVPCSTWTAYFILYNGPPLPALKIAPSHGGSGPPSNTWFPGPTRALNPKGILISLAISAGLTIATDRQTDRQTDRHATLSVTTGRIYERSTAMWPKETTIDGKRQKSYPVSTFDASVVFFFCRARIFSSTVSLHTNLTSTHNHHHHTTVLRSVS